MVNTRKRILTICTLFAVAGSTVSVAGAAGIPFADGPGSARKIQAKLARNDLIHEPRCSYHRPVIRCTYYARRPREDAYLRVKATIYKTGPGVGYGITCWPLLGVCDRERVRFTG